MTNESNWITGFSAKQTTKPVLEYLKQQAKDLSDQTEGKVHAELAYTNSMAHSIARSMILVTSKLQHGKLFEDSKDASLLYDKTSYDFFIYDEKHKYEFVLFQLECNDMFPVKILMDATVAQEMKMGDALKIESFGAFTQLFVRMIQTNKVVYIIHKLMNLEEREVIEGVSEEIDDSEEATEDNG